LSEYDGGGAAKARELALFSRLIDSQQVIAHMRGRRHYVGGEIFETDRLRLAMLALERSEISLILSLCGPIPSSLFQLFI